MRTTALRRLIAASCAAAALGTGVAFACVPQPVVTLEPQGSGPAGSEVTVRGIVLSGDSEIRWNGIDGPLLAKANGTEISVPVKIPDVDSGLYTVIVFERAANGAVGNKATASFLVTGVDGTSPIDGTSGAAHMPTARPAPSAAGSEDRGIDARAALAGGAVLLALGGIGGGAIARRRTATSAPGPA